MADVTAALVTFNEIAICGSDGNKMLVASVPMAADRNRQGAGDGNVLRRGLALFALVSHGNFRAEA